MFKSLWFCAFVFFIASFVVISFFIPDISCVDGWISTSIGRQGACSHHGGVDYTNIVLVSLISFFMTIVICKKIKTNRDGVKAYDKVSINKKSGIPLSVILIANKICCIVWNGLIKSLIFVGFKRVFNKYPLITVIGCFVIVTISSIVMSVVFCLAVVAFLNGASAESGFLVTKKKDFE